jgi:hypothetical protein
MEQLISLPYLDAVVRESLRLRPPVASLAKVAMKDDLILLDVPFIDTKGNTQRAIRYISTFESKRAKLTIPLSESTRVISYLFPCAQSTEAKPCGERTLQSSGKIGCHSNSK